MSEFRSVVLWPDVAVACLAVILSSIIARAIWNLRFSPLAQQQIPGPAYAAVSDLWYQWQAIRFRRVFEVERLFKEYGPVVRVGPNRVAFLDTQPIHEMYRAFAFNKAEWWKHGNFGGGTNTLITNDSVQHARFRRWHSPGFRGDRLKKTAQALIGQMENLVERLHSDCADGRAVDVLRLSKVHTLDMLGIALFDFKFEQIRKREEPALIQYNNDWLVDLAFRSTFPQVVYNLLKKLPVRRLQEIFSADAGICEVSERMYDATPDEPTETEGMNIVALGKWSRDPVTGDKTPRAEVVSELGIFLLAGTDTTSVTLTMILYELALQSKLYLNIRDELRQIGDQERVYNIDFLRGLPYLGAVIKDVLRVHGPASAYLERTVSAGGIELGGFTLPAGTEVGATARATGRNEILFPNPELVDPERWVERKGDKWVERDDFASKNSAWFPFGVGVRACVGRSLAEVEILMTIAAVVSNFRITLHETTTKESMTPVDVAVVGPKAQRCLLHFASHGLTED
ncbi:cytochrome P450 [Auriculariales sp. MPI-PUGE-AT-0066]|nr:cytochrome P450 [Auriculariales sp. MPI-PUGE-AT-0066]